MYDKKEFLEKVNEFIVSDNQIALIKGYENYLKFLGVLKVLNTTDYKNGTIHTRAIGRLKDLLFEKQIIPKNVKQHQRFRLNNLTLNIDLYERNIYSNNDFSIYYPVESALKNSSTYLINHIKNNDSKKIFIITTNDWDLNTDYIEEICDTTIILDIRHFDMESYKTIYRNKKGFMPY
ncbi:hypothetical protein ACOSZA_10510 [Mammaliicoccus sciuri]|uniref:hypothetical protein n=1 Tax=Mammaliicoccus sciuri TaxID=1296 RepID=UPI003BA3CC78